MKLLVYEWRKILWGKVSLLLLLFFCINIGMYYVYMIPAMPSELEKKVRNKWEATLEERGEDAENDYQFLMEKIEEEPEGRTEEEIQYLLAEWSALCDLSEEYGVVGEYKNFIGEMKARAERLQGFSIFNKEGSFSQRNIEKTVDDFKQMEKMVIVPQNEIGMQCLHNFYLTDILMLLIVFMLCFQGYGQDSKKGMGNLIEGTLKGKGTLRFAQMKAIMLTTVIVAILFYGTNILLTRQMLGIGESAKYVQGMGMFRNVPYFWTVGMYLVLFVAWKAFALLFAAVLIQFLGVRFNGKKFSWIVGGVICVVSFGLWFFVPNSPETKLFRYLNLIGLLDVRQILGNYQNLNLFGYPVSLVYAAILFIGIFVIFLGICTILVKKREVRLGKLNIKVPHRKKRRVWKKPFSFELHKVFIDQKVIIIPILLMIVSICWLDVDSRVSGREYYYEEYIQYYEGEYTEEKSRDIEVNWIKQKTPTVEASDALNRLYDQRQYLLKLDSENKGFLNLRKANALFFNEQQEIKNMLFIVIAIIFSVNALFYQEKRNQMKGLLYTMPKSKSVYWGKIRLSVLMGMLYSLIVWGVTYVKYFMGFDMKGWEFSIRSIPGMELLGRDISVGVYLMLTILFRIAIGMYIGILAGVIVQVLEIPTQNIIFSILVFVLPLCLSYIAKMEYENPLTDFIQKNLTFILKPMESLSLFPTVWFKIGIIGIWLFIEIPLASLYFGKCIWEERGE